MMTNAKTGNDANGLDDPLPALGGGAERPRREPIALIGMGLRFPGGADDPAAFWHILSEGRDVITEVPLDRWNPRAFYDPEPGKPGKTNARWGGFLADVDRFDPHFFDISPREAARMDPQQRLLLEVAWEALEDGGQTLERLRGSDTAVFVGVSSWEYATVQTSYRDLSDIDVYSNIGLALSIVANRISYCFNFKGPSAAVDSACSSGLLAVHLACRSIWDEGCPLALAGGVSLLLSPNSYIGFSRLAMLSPDGRCKAFDAGANGFVRSEGAGVVVLKPLRQALADRDRIYALIRGTAVNQDGRTSGLTVPSQEAQTALLRQACRQAGVSPADIQYVEAHGTGTLVGDPIEARALGAALSPGRPPDRPCIVGSVKTNIGHLEAAAGIAGLIKTALALKHRLIPANMHFRVPNPEIPFEDLKLKVPQQLLPWPAGGPALASVNSFGFGGTNAHVVLEEAPRPPPRHANDEAAPGRAELVPLSARSAAALQALARSVKDFLATADASFADVVGNLGLRRTHDDHRLALVAHSNEELAEQLAALAAGQPPAGTCVGRATADQRPRLAFVFCGQGPQWWAMGRQLLASEPVFQEIVRRCDAQVRRLGGWSLLEELNADEAHSRMDLTVFAQPALFAVQVGLAAVWASWGVRPEAVIGHSVGEVAAAYVAGCLGLEEAVRVIFHRGRCMELAPSRGRMLAVGLPRDEAQRLVASCGSRIALAAVNGPTSVTLSGETAALEEIEKALGKRQVFARFLLVQYAFHSSQMDPVRDTLLAALDGLAAQPARLPLFSTVSGRRVEGPELGPDYWWRNVRQTVEFAAGVERLVEAGCNTVLELGPHPILASVVAEVYERQGKKATVLASLRRKEEERVSLLRSLGQLYVLGYPIDTAAVWHDTGRFVRLPSYPWQRERFWHEAPESRAMRLGPPPHPLLGVRLPTAGPCWEGGADLRLLPWLGDHRVQHRALLPATGYLEIAFAAARELFAEVACCVEDVQLMRACFLAQDERTTLQLTYSPTDATFRIHSETRDGEAPSWTAHASGTLRPRPAAAPAVRFCPDEFRRRCRAEVAGPDCYSLFNKIGLHYGASFQGIERLWQGSGEALALVVVPQALQGQADDYVVHPAVLDACLQALCGALSPDDGAATIFLPVEIEQVRLYARPGRRLWSHARICDKTHGGFLAQIDVYDESGAPLVQVCGLRCQSVGTGPGTEEALDDLMYEYQWRPQPWPAQEQAGRSFEGLASFEPAVAAAAAVDRVRGHLGLKERLDRLTPRLDRLCTGLIWQAFRCLGGELSPGLRLTADALADRLGIAAQHRRLVDRYVGLLAEDGVLVRRGDEWEVAATPACTDPDGEWQALMREFPAYFAELTLTGRCGRRLAGVLRGEINPLDLIFPDGSLNTAEHLYQDSPSVRLVNTMAREALAAVVAGLPEGRTLRVLEVGAGTGGFTSYVLPRLPGERTEYVYTDLSHHFFVQARDKFHNYPFVKYQKLDVEKDPVEQGFGEHSFDVVIASQVLHATAELRQTLSHIRRVLASEGVLLLVEVTRPPRWTDLVFGLTEGWWKYSDSDLRPAYPLLSFAAWKGLLEQLGYTQTVNVAADGGHDAIILTRGPRVELPAVLAAAPPTEEPGSWLLFADRGGVAETLADRLRAQGQTCTLVYNGRQHIPADDRRAIDSTRREELVQLLREVLGPDRPACRGIVHLWSLDAPAAEGLSTPALEAFLQSNLLCVLHITQAWSEVADDRNAGLWLVTRGACSLGLAPRPPAMAQAPLTGMGRVIANEFPRLRCKMVDLDPAAGPASSASWLFEELLVQDDEEEVAVRAGCRYVHRYLRGMTPRRADRNAGPAPYRLTVSPQATLDALTLRAIRRLPPGPGQVEIEVGAAALNFSDVLKALGIYPGLPAGPVPLGAECSGRISAVGAGVEGLKVGDAVVAITPFSLGSHVRTAALFTALLPPHLTFEEGATLPIAFLTAVYALEHLGRLAEGEKVLIHSATGGVGLAALQLARRAGAEVFATAGTPEKRELLRALGVEHVMDSRSLAFAEQVRERTGGRGVDVVLNSLAGEAIAKGLDTLADYGRFLEIGKRDIYQNSRLGLRSFRKNLSFIAIDLDRVMRERPQLMGRLFGQVVRDVAGGKLTPLPHRVFSIANVVSAFRHLQQGKHVGKVVLSLRDRPACVAAGPVDLIAFRPDGSYLITGGLGGFGLEVARWMVEHGARHLVLMGRRGVHSEEVRRAVAELENAGAQVHVVAGDVSEEADVARALAHVDRHLPPLRGVVHAAMVLEDCLLQNLHWEQLRRVIAPKVHGAWNLHTQTLDRPLDHFILFSSLSSVFGFPGQANYASANTFLDALAYYRRAQGLPCLSVNWGYLGGVGYVAQRPQLAERLEALGVKPFTIGQALTLLERALRQEAVQIGVMGIDWTRWRGWRLADKLSPRFAHLCKEVEAATEGATEAGLLSRKAIQAAPPAKRLAMLQALLREKVARVLGSSASRLDMEKPLLNLGLDSLMAVELRNWMESELQVNVPIVELMRSPSLARLAELLLEQLAPGVAPAATGHVDPSAEKPAGAFAVGINLLRQAGTGGKGESSRDLNAAVVLDEAIRPGQAAPAGLVLPRNLFLTGATGFVGAFLAEELLRGTPAVLHCLVRAATAAEGLERLRANLDAYGLWQEAWRERLVVVPGDLTQPLLGLSEKRFEQLADQLDAVFHPGAAVQFVADYESLAPANVGGTHEILRLVGRGTWKQLHYVSSLAVFSLLDHRELKVCREADEPRRCEALHLGYSQSKWVAEQLVLRARARGLPVCVYRPGVITGHSRTGVGHWEDFISRIIRGCIRIGAVPDMDVPVDMTPVDYVCEAIARLSQRPESVGQVFHLVNPRMGTWAGVVAWLRSYGYSLRVQPYNAWREGLLAHEGFTADNALFGLSPLLTPVPENGKMSIPEIHFDARNAAAALAGSGLDCPPLDGRLLQTYFGYCTRSGLIPPPPTEAGNGDGASRHD
jgi:thioester reductase-like protein